MNTFINKKNSTRLCQDNTYIEKWYIGNVFPFYWSEDEDEDEYEDEYEDNDNDNERKRYDDTDKKHHNFIVGQALERDIFINKQERLIEQFDHEQRYKHVKFLCSQNQGIIK